MANAKKCDFCEGFFVPEGDITQIIFANNYGCYLSKNKRDICPVCLMKLKHALIDPKDREKNKA